MTGMLRIHPRQEFEADRVINRVDDSLPIAIHLDFTLKPGEWILHVTDDIRPGVGSGITRCFQPELFRKYATSTKGTK